MYMTFWQKQVNMSMGSTAGVAGVVFGTAASANAANSSAELQSIPLIVPAVGPPKNWPFSRFGIISDIFVDEDPLTYE